MTDILMALTGKTPEQIFAEENLKNVIEKVEADAKAFVPDLTTKDGREAIASKAYAVAKLKNQLDKIGKELGVEWKTKLDALNKRRSNIWDKLEATQKSIRAPLDEWENSEAQRLEALKTRMLELGNCGNLSLTATMEQINHAYEELRRLYQFNWEEMLDLADIEMEKIKAVLDKRKEERQKYDAEQAELVRLREEAEIRKKKDEEEAVAKTAAEKAKKEAEDKAAKEASDLAKKEADEKALIEKQKRDAEEKALQSERDRIASEEKAAKDRIAAEEKAATDRITAAKAEAEAQEKIRKAEQDRRDAELKSQAEELARKESEAALQQAQIKIDEFEANQSPVLNYDSIAKIISAWALSHNLKLTEDMVLDLNERFERFLNKSVA